MMWPYLRIYASEAFLVTDRKPIHDYVITAGVREAAEPGAGTSVTCSPWGT